MPEVYDVEQDGGLAPDGLRTHAVYRLLVAHRLGGNDGSECECGRSWPMLTDDEAFYAHAQHVAELIEPPDPTDPF